MDPATTQAVAKAAEESPAEAARLVGFEMHPPPA